MRSMVPCTCLASGGNTRKGGQNAHSNVQIALQALPALGHHLLVVLIKRCDLCLARQHENSIGARSSNNASCERSSAVEMLLVDAGDSLRCNCNSPAARVRWDQSLVTSQHLRVPPRASPHAAADACLDPQNLGSVSAAQHAHTPMPAVYGNAVGLTFTAAIRRFRCKNTGRRAGQRTTTVGSPLSVLTAMTNSVLPRISPAPASTYSLPVIVADKTSPYCAARARLLSSDAAKTSSEDAAAPILMFLDTLGSGRPSWRMHHARRQRGQRSDRHEPEPASGGCVQLQCAPCDGVRTRTRVPCRGTIKLKINLILWSVSPRGDSDGLVTILES